MVEVDGLHAGLPCARCIRRSVSSTIVLSIADPVFERTNKRPSREPTWSSLGTSKLL
jgi:hypothetical protein